MAAACVSAKRRVSTRVVGTWEDLSLQLLSAMPRITFRCSFPVSSAFTRSSWSSRFVEASVRSTFPRTKP